MSKRVWINYHVILELIIKHDKLYDIEHIIWHDELDNIELVIRYYKLDKLDYLEHNDQYNKHAM